MNKKLEDNIRMFDKWSLTYDSRLFQFWMRKFHRPVFKEINFSQPVKILDLSCGTGELLLALWNKSNRKAKLYGLDISSQMLSVARGKLPQSVVLKEGDVHDLPFSEHSFDYVMSTEAFHHYYNQQKVLQEMKRTVKNGGKVIVVDINFFFRFVHWLFEKFEPGCVHVNSRREMKKLFLEAGLVNIKQERTFLFAVVTSGVKY